MLTSSEANREFPSRAGQRQASIHGTLTAFKTIGSDYHAYFTYSRHSRARWCRDIRRRRATRILRRRQCSPAASISLGRARTDDDDARAPRIDALRRRVSEMRSPAPPLDTAPDAAIDWFVEELLRARDEIELLTGIYGVALPALANAYTTHLARTNPLVDHPTRQCLRPALADVDEAIAWGAAALAALFRNDPASAARAAEWRGPPFPAPPSAPGGGGG